MGKIMRNGNKYSCASPNNAQSVVYDNTTSGLEAENTKEAIDELSSKIDEQNKKTLYKITEGRFSEYGEITHQMVILKNKEVSYKITFNANTKIEDWAKLFKIPDEIQPIGDNDSEYLDEKYFSFIITPNGTIVQSFISPSGNRHIVATGISNYTSGTFTFIGNYHIL